MRLWLRIFIIIPLGLYFCSKEETKHWVDILKNKINKTLEEREGNKLFFDINDKKYPGADSTSREKHREQWEEYYQCLKNQHSNLGQFKTVFPIALIAMERTSVTLKCQICISPSEMNMIGVVEWYFNSSSNPNSVSEQVYSTEHLLISTDGNLSIYHIQLDQAGQYWCRLGDTIAAPYYIHVDNGSEPVLVVRSNKAQKAIHSRPPTIIPELNLKAFTSWTDWSGCSTCDVVGVKTRYGYCTISLLGNSQFKNIVRKEESVRENRDLHFPPRNIARMGDIKVTQEKEQYYSNLKKLINSVLPVFRNRLPCRSKNTPLEIQNIIDVKTRKSEIMLQYCKVSCPRNEISKERDKYGNILGSMNNNAGIYSFDQDLLELVPSVTRVTFHRQRYEKCELKCPGNLNSNAPFTWKVGNKVLAPSSIKKQTSGRIQISSKQSIIFKKLRLGDGNIYSCWQNNKLAGTIRLEVSFEMKIEFDRYILIISGVAIVIVFSKVFWRIYLGRKRFTMH